MRGAEDYRNFSTALDALATAFRVPITDALRTVYWTALIEYPFHVVGRAMTECLHTCQHFPRIADIRHALIHTQQTSGTQGMRGGTFPPDSAARRRALGLPVTPEEFVAYDRQTHEGGGRRLSRAERAAILRASIVNTRASIVNTRASIVNTRASIVNTKSVVYRTAVLKLAERLEQGEDVTDAEVLGVFAGAVRGRSTRI